MQGGTRSQALSNLAIAIWEWCLQRKIYLSAIHIPGVINKTQDGLPCQKLESTEWMLESSVFRQIVAVYQQPQVNLFASHQNHQLPNCFFWIPDPHAMGTDAFSIPGKFCATCFSISAYSEMYSENKQDQTDALFIIPVWKSRPWLPSFIRNADKTASSITPSCQIASSSNVSISSSLINEQENPSSRLACVGKSVKEQGISKRVSKILLSSWRSSREKYYQSAWKSFDGWCFEKSEDPISCLVNSVLEFLTDLFDKGLQHQTINTYHSAI